MGSPSHSSKSFWLNLQLQEDIDQFGDVGSLEDNVESFLSHDDGEGRDLFGTLNGNPAHSAAASKGNIWLHALNSVN